MEIAALEGVASRSVGEGHDRRIEIYAGDSAPAESSDAE
jgi:hypothetical protein